MSDPWEAVAKEMFSKINDSYMVFNKGAKHGINFNTELLIKKLVATALREAVREATQKTDSVTGKINTHYVEVDLPPEPKGEPYILLSKAKEMVRQENEAIAKEIELGHGCCQMERFCHGYKDDQTILHNFDCPLAIATAIRKRRERR